MEQVGFSNVTKKIFHSYPGASVNTVLNARHEALRCPQNLLVTNIFGIPTLCHSYAERASLLLMNILINPVNIGKLKILSDWSFTVSIYNDIKSSTLDDASADVHVTQRCLRFLVFTDSQIT